MTFPIPNRYFRTTSATATALHSGRLLSTNETPPIPSPSARRAALAGFLDLLLPGLGHAVIGRRGRSMLLFLVPMVLLIAAVLGYYAGGGWSGILAFIVAPGVLPA